MSIPIKYNDISQLVQIIKALKPLSVTLDYPGKTDWDKISIDLLKHPNIKDVQYVLEDILPIDPDAAGLIASMHMWASKKDTDIQSKNKRLLLSMLLSNDIYESLLDDQETFLKYYQNNPSPEMIEMFIRYATVFSAYALERYDMFKVIVQHIDRDTFYSRVKDIDADEDYEKLYMVGYDKAAKQRAVEVSLGLGYAQMDNQVQSTIPSLVLQEIVNQSADVSGMPAWQVYQIVKHINEGITDHTIRLGQPSNFADATE